MSNDLLFINFINIHVHYYIGHLRVYVSSSTTICECLCECLCSMVMLGCLGPHNSDPRVVNPALDSGSTVDVIYFIKTWYKLPQEMLLFKL